MSLSRAHRYAATLMVATLLFGGALPLVQHVCAHLMHEPAEECCCFDSHPSHADDDCDHDHAQDTPNHEGLVLSADCCDLTVQQADPDAVTPRTIQVDASPAATEPPMATDIRSASQVATLHLSNRGPPLGATHDLFLLNEVFLS